jgi:hypothetical protein
MKLFDLGSTLFQMSDAILNRGEDPEGKDRIVSNSLLEIEKKTGVNSEKLKEMEKRCADENMGLGNLRMMIIGDMQKRKVSTAFII